MSTTQTTRPTNLNPMPRVGSSAGSQTPAPTTDLSTPTEQASGRDQTSPQATPLPNPTPCSPAGAKTTDFPGDHKVGDAHVLSVAGDQDQSTASAVPASKAETPSADDSPPAAIQRSAASVLPPQVGDPFLALAADVVDDLEKVRIANENRLRQLTRTETDADGEERGFGLTEDHPDVARLAALVDMLAQAEHQGVLNLQRIMRKHPLGPWVKATKGVGEKQAARLLGAIGDPYIRPELVRKDDTVEPSRPRTVSELWAYCGLHVLPVDHARQDAQKSTVGGNQSGCHPGHTWLDAQVSTAGVAPKRQKGQRANWSTVAKTRAYLVAESCIKQRTSPFRAVYDNTRAKYADAIHKVPCARCGPSGKPAPAGSPLSDGHKHARAMRAVSKEILKELWRRHRTPRPRRQCLQRKRPEVGTGRRSWPARRRPVPERRDPWPDHARVVHALDGPPHALPPHSDVAGHARSPRGSSMSGQETTWDWGPGAVATLLACAAASILGGGLVGWFWLANTYDWHAFAVTVVQVAIVADLGVGAYIGRRLVCSGGRRP